MTDRTNSVKDRRATQVVELEEPEGTVEVRAGMDEAAAADFAALRPEGAEHKPRRMQPRTVRRWLVATFVVDLILLAVALWDYFLNDSEWIVPVLVVFVLLVVIAFILFLLASRQDERVVVRLVEREGQPAQTVYVPQPTATVAPAIPPAPVRTTVYIPPVPPAKPKALRTVAAGPFVYKGYTLHSRSVKLNGGGSRTIYFFSKRKPRSGKPCAKPAGYHVGVNERTGLPFLKKGAGCDGEDLTPEAPDAYRPQCAAVTADGAQCRNSAREGSKYCAPHFGYQPKTEKGLAKHIEGATWSDEDAQTDAATVAEADIKAAVRGAPDMAPSVRKPFLRRRKK